MGKKAKIRAGVLPRKKKRVPRQTRRDPVTRGSNERALKVVGLPSNQMKIAPPVKMLPDLGVYFETVGFLEPFRIKIYSGVQVAEGRQRRGFAEREYGYCLTFVTNRLFLSRAGDSGGLPLPFFPAIGTIILGPDRDEAIERALAIGESGLLVKLAPEKSFSTDGGGVLPVERVVPFEIADDFEGETDGFEGETDGDSR